MFQIHHYCCDGYDDTGWGCVYRNTQSILSYLNKDVPSIPQMLDFFNKPHDGHGSKMWIEPHQSALFLKGQLKNRIIEVLYVKDDKAIEHVMFTPIEIYTSYPNLILSGKEGMMDLVKMMDSHLANGLSPIMIDNGTYSYLIKDIHDGTASIVDPHCSKGVRILSRDLFRWLSNSVCWMCLIVDQ